MIIESLVSDVTKDLNLPIQLISPHMDKVPEDDLLSYISVTAPIDILKEYKSNEVLMFPTEQYHVLKMWNLNQETMGKSILILTDIPSVDYDGEFNESTTRGSKVAYHALIGDLAEASRRAEMVGDATVLDKEQRSITKKSGEIRKMGELDFDESED